MHDLPNRAALAVLLTVGIATAVPPVVEVAQASLVDPQALFFVLHRHWLLAVLGLALVASVFFPILRPAAVSGAVLSKAGTLAIAAGAGAVPSSGLWPEALGLGALIVTGAWLARAAWQQARWDGLLPLRPEA